MNSREKSLSQAVRELRAACGMNQVDFASALHIGQGGAGISKYERGQAISAPILSRMEQLAVGSDRPDLAGVFSAAIQQKLGAGGSPRSGSAREHRDSEHSVSQNVREAFESCLPANQVRAHLMLHEILAGGIPEYVHAVVANLVGWSKASGGIAARESFRNTTPGLPGYSGTVRDVDLAVKRSKESGKGTRSSEDRDSKGAA